MKRYGQKTPPKYEMSNIKFPIAVFSGSQDKQADPADVHWTEQQLQHTIIFQHEYYLGHTSFVIAKDMSFFTVDAMAVLNHYNDKCDPSTSGSKFTEGNDRCSQNETMFLY